MWGNGFSHSATVPETESSFVMQHVGKCLLFESVDFGFGDVIVYMCGISTTYGSSRMGSVSMSASVGAPMLSWWRSHQLISSIRGLRWPAFSSTTLIVEVTKRLFFCGGGIFIFARALGPGHFDSTPCR